MHPWCQSQAKALGFAAGSTGPSLALCWRNLRIAGIRPLLLKQCGLPSLDELAPDCWGFVFVKTLCSPFNKVLAVQPQQNMAALLEQTLQPTICCITCGQVPVTPSQPFYRDYGQASAIKSWPKASPILQASGAAPVAWFRLSHFPRLAKQRQAIDRTRSVRANVTFPLGRALCCAWLSPVPTLTSN